MDIIVLIKEVPDLNVWIEIDPKTLRIDPDDLIFIANPSDLMALLLAVRLVQRSGTGSVTAVHLGPKRAERTLRNCLEFQANRAIHIIYENIAELESYQIATVLAETIGRLNLSYDVIFCGHDYSGSGFASGQISSQVAARLNLPEISHVVRIETSPDRCDLLTESLLDSGDRVTLRCKPPLLIATHPEAEPVSCASLEAKLDALDMQVECVRFSDLHLIPSEMVRRTSLLSVSASRPRPKRVFVPQSTLSATERIRLIMGGGLGKKQTDLLPGTPGDLAKQIFDFLIQSRILGPGPVRE